MLGNDRANDFWAARLSVSEELDCDALPDQRREFITQKYREGRFRLAHPAFSSHEELLKVTDGVFPLDCRGAVCIMMSDTERLHTPTTQNSCF